jgi:transcription elongation factor B subunit 2
MEIFLMVRRHKTTIFLDTKENATVADVKKMLAGIIKRPPEDQRLCYEKRILDEREELRHCFQHGNGVGRAQNPATFGLMLRDPATGEFEQLHITEYSQPPELPSAMEKDDESL